MEVGWQLLVLVVVVVAATLEEIATGRLIEVGRLIGVYQKSALGHFLKRLRNIYTKWREKEEQNHMKTTINITV